MRYGLASAARYSQAVLPTRPGVLQFGPYTLDLGAAQLTRAGQAVALRPKAFDLLRVLAERPGELVTKDELLDSVWGRRFVSESVIKSVVSELRQVLGDGSSSAPWIETVPRRGYRFAAAVLAALPAAAPGPAPAASAKMDAGTGTTQSVATATSPAPSAPVFNANHFPVVLAPPVGREADLATLGGMLESHRLVTIAGPAGVGKTRLALAWAATQQSVWRDGMWWVELAPRAAETTDAAALCAALAQTLGLGPAAARDSSALAAALRPLQLLMVLDNAEHLLAALAPLLATLLAQAPGLRLLLTSQEPLHIAGEQVFRLAPLDVPLPGDDGDAARLMASGAVRLFVERAGARLPGFRLEPAQQGSVAGICRALDGLPLALELAAARISVLGIQGIARLLVVGAGDDSARLHLLKHGSRDALPRQSSLRNALEWSHALLDDAQRRVFRRLGVFRGGFTLEAAQAVSSDDALDHWGVLDAVHGLVDKSLVVGSASAHGTPRFTMLESLRSFALERLAEAGETVSTRNRHLQAAMAVWTQSNAQVLQTPLLAWQAQYQPEIDNLRAALQWAQREGGPAEDALRLVVQARMFWHCAGLVGEGRAHCEAVRAQAGLSTEASLRGGFALAVALLALYGNAYAPAEAALGAEQAAVAFEYGGDQLHAYHAHYLAYQLRLRAGDHSGRDVAVARLAALEDPQWNDLLTRFGRTARGYEHRLSGRLDDYLLFCRDERARMRRQGAVVESWSMAHGLMLAEHDAGHSAAALAAGREALAEIRAAGRLRQHATFFALWTTLLAAGGESAGTRLALAELLPALHSAGTPWMAQVALAWLAASDGRVADAARLLGWHEAEQCKQRGLASGPTITRVMQALGQHLAQQASAADLSTWREQGAELGDGGAEALSLAEPD